MSVTLPGGNVQVTEITEISLALWLENYPPAGEYAWTVEAVDANDALLCAAGPFIFSKPQSPAGEAGGGDGEGGDDGRPGSDPGDDPGDD